MSDVARMISVPSAINLRLESNRRGETVGLCHGCFDILHSGHVYHLAQASERVNVLIVSVTSDRYVNKGDDRPIFSHQCRMRVLAALRPVDYVVLNDHPTATPLIRCLRPDFYIKGPDYTAHSGSRIAEEREAIIAVGGTFLTTDAAVVDSSSRAAAALTGRGADRRDWWVCAPPGARLTMPRREDDGSSA